MSKASLNERSNYHATFGDLIDKLKNVDDVLQISPKIVGLGAYRGYYSDIALCTESGSSAYKSSLDYDSTVKNLDKWYKENEVNIDFRGTPKKLAEKLESLIGMYFEGRKGGYYEITRDKPLWLANDYSDNSYIAIIGISDNLELITKKIDENRLIP